LKVEHLTFVLHRILEQPISDAEMVKALAPYYPDRDLQSGPIVGGFIFSTKNGGAPIPLGYRNVDGPWCWDEAKQTMTLGASQVPSEHFVGVFSSQAANFHQAFPNRLQSMAREVNVRMMFAGK